MGWSRYRIHLNEEPHKYDQVKGDLYGNPDLVVEISSPSTAAYDRYEKFPLYERNGVPWMWLIDQDTLAIEEFQWTPDGYLHSGTTAPGELFRPQLFDELALDLVKLVELD